MKQKTTKFGCYWMKISKICGELRIDAGLLRFKDHMKIQKLSMLAGSDAQLEKLSEMGRCMTAMADDLLLEHKKKRDWIDM